KYKIPIKEVVKGGDIRQKAYTGRGILVNSEKFNGKENEKAKELITEELKKKGLGKKIVQYKLRDWMISRQRYWGTPIPIIYCKKCGIVPVPEKDLPVLLPEKVDFNSATNPLLTSKEFLNVECPKCGEMGRRETDTMGGFVDSSWYFLRYCDSKNKKKAFDSEKVNYWMPVDQYVGGAEHAVMHLMYARFFTKVLKDLKLLKFDEPFMKLFNQGIVYKDGHKMSKSFGNVVFQTDISDKYGIDTARLFLMSVSSPEKQMEWSDEGAEGSYRFINKLVRNYDKVKKIKIDEKTESKLNALIINVTESIENFNYPKAIISIFEFLDYLSNLKHIPEKSFEDLLKMISPFCPHIAEELWEKLGNKGFISLQKWPAADEKKVNRKFEEQDKQTEKVIEDIRNITNIFREKKKKEPSVAYVYVIPNELQIYEDKIDEFKRRTNLDIRIFSASDKNKHDPESRAKKTKPGKPALYLE
ncbi:MAG TPA: class I tRNA ligase family protein, partial [Patescibacteria group bacterium]|nr:class I tRNA ligase family protein [Patescibacteria group bacterium]